MSEENKYKFSVAMSVYKNDKPEQLELALESVCTQSLPPDEIYLVIDGPISEELRAVINEYAEEYENFTINQLEVNGGLGNALAIAVEKCKYDLIIRMDSDDICAPGRFKKQIEAYKAEPCDVIGGWTLGFIGDIENGQVSSAKRKLTHEELMKRLPHATPISHVTALFRREAVLRAGNYMHLHYHEDYYLWVRMALAGCKFRNIPEYLVYVRLGHNQALRHGGWKYYKSGAFLRKFMLKNGLCGFGTYIKETLVRIVYQLLIHARLRNYLAMKYKRKYLTRDEADAILKKNRDSDALKGAFAQN